LTCGSRHRAPTAAAWVSSHCGGWSGGRLSRPHPCRPLLTRSRRPRRGPRVQPPCCHSWRCASTPLLSRRRRPAGRPTLCVRLAGAACARVRATRGGNAPRHWRPRVGRRRHSCWIPERGSHRAHTVVTTYVRPRSSAGRSGNPKSLPSVLGYLAPRYAPLIPALLAPAPSAPAPAGANTSPSGHPRAPARSPHVLPRAPAPGPTHALPACSPPRRRTRAG